MLNAVAAHFQRSSVMHVVHLLDIVNILLNILFHSFIFCVLAHLLQCIENVDRLRQRASDL